MLEACADRLWLVDSGTVKPFAGDMDDYKKLVLEKAAAASAKPETSAPKPQPARAAKSGPSLKKRLASAEEKMARFQELLERVDSALADPDAFLNEPVKAAQLAKQRSELAAALAAAEEEWLALSSEMEAQAG